MLEEAIISIFLVIVIGVFMLFIKTSISIPEQYEVDENISENKERKPYLLLQ